MKKAYFRITIAAIVLAAIAIFLPCVCACRKENNEMHVIASDESSLSYMNGSTPYSMIDELVQKRANAESFFNQTSLAAIKPCDHSIGWLMNNIATSDVLNAETVIWYYGLVKSDEGILLLMFDANLTCISEHPISLSKATATVMRNVVIGMSVEEVYSLDPDGDYTDVLYRSFVMSPYYSLHFLESGELYIIVYDDQCLVTNVSSEIF